MSDDTESTEHDGHCPYNGDPNTCDCWHPDVRTVSEVERLRADEYGRLNAAASDPELPRTLVGETALAIVNERLSEARGELARQRARADQNVSAVLVVSGQRDEAVAQVERVRALADDWDESRRPGMVGISTRIRAAIAARTPDDDAEGKS